MIHAITAWTGRIEDETPLCKSAASFGSLTTDHHIVSCPKCRAISGQHGIAEDARRKADPKYLRALIHAAKVVLSSADSDHNTEDDSTHVLVSRRDIADLRAMVNVCQRPT